jgi:uncharacterized protein (DUF1697 family)
MIPYIALLRAVNVGGTGKLPMRTLKQLCEQAGFAAVRTYIASGNVVFRSAQPAVAVQAELTRRLVPHLGAKAGVLLRTAAELQAIHAANPFPDAPGNRAMVVFLDTPPPADTLAKLRGQQDEQVRLGAREIYVCYPQGMARTRLTIPAAAAGTMRNMNTVAKLIELAGVQR